MERFDKVRASHPNGSQIFLSTIGGGSARAINMATGMGGRNIRE